MTTRADVPNCVYTGAAQQWAAFLLDDYICSPTNTNMKSTLFLLFTLFSTAACTEYPEGTTPKTAGNTEAAFDDEAVLRVTVDGCEYLGFPQVMRTGATASTTFTVYQYVHKGNCFNTQHLVFNVR